MSTENRKGRPFQELRNRAIVALRYFDPTEFTFAKIAELLGKSHKRDVQIVFQRDANKYLTNDQMKEYENKLVEKESVDR